MFLKNIMDSRLGDIPPAGSLGAKRHTLAENKFTVVFDDKFKRKKKGHFVGL